MLLPNSQSYSTPSPKPLHSLQRTLSTDCTRKPKYATLDRKRNKVRREKRYVYNALSTALELLGTKTSGRHELLGNKKTHNIRSTYLPTYQRPRDPSLSAHRKLRHISQRTDRSLRTIIIPTTYSSTYGKMELRDNMTLQITLLLVSSVL